MNPDALQAVDRDRLERQARRMDLFMTIVVLLVLLIPLPFARFEAFPSGDLISEHMIMPWSDFKICYSSFPNADPVEESYRFTWKGELIPKASSKPVLFAVNSMEPPVLKWQSLPDVRLGSLFLDGDMIRLRTFWQPIIFWPIKMVLHACSQLKGYPG